MTRRLPAFLRGRTLLCLVMAFAAGIAAAYYLCAAPLVWLLAAAAAAAFFIIWYLCRRTLPWQICLPLAFVLGAFLCAQQTAALDAWVFHDGQNIAVSGKVTDLTAQEDGWRAKLRVETVYGEDFSCAPIYVYGDGGMPRGGSTIRVKGRVFSASPYANSNAFDYNKYLRMEGIAGAVSAKYTGEVVTLRDGPAFWWGDVSQWLRDGLDEAATCLTEKQKALVYGVFLGDKSGLDYEMKNALALSGVLHVFAVSGMHVGYIVFLALLMTGSAYRKRLRRFVLCLCLLLLYIGMTGAAASILRASLMAMCLLLASLLDEENDTPTAMALAALVCLLAKPLWLFSAGFQLSFAAVCGILAFLPMFNELLRFLPKIFRELFAVCFGASLGTLPLICYYFYHISWWGWLLSPLVILAAGAAVILSFCAVVIAVFSPWLGGIFLQAAAYGLEPVYWLSSEFGSRSAQVTGAVYPVAVVIFYMAAAFLPLLLKRAGKTACAGGLLLILLCFTLGAPVSTVSTGLKGEITEIVFLDVGQGDCAFIKTADGKTVMIDGGGTYTEGDIGAYDLLPYLKSRGVTHIDMIVNSHPDADHTDGLISVLEQLDVDELVWADVWQDEGMAEQLRRAAAENGVAVSDIRAGTVRRIGEDLTLSCYYPTAEINVLSAEAEVNDYSFVCEISCGETDVLFTGDMGGEKLRDICAENEVEAEIIKVPHHGSITGYADGLADILDTQAAVISVGENNSYGHPQGKVVKYWQEHGAVYRTDEDGAVTVYTNGTEYEIVTYNGDA
ncbi:MAG: DNA internalization-related competence protein ComEC/Rec2 [Firmicutes bacterium]|nr:DNA internalization-related competence protein ComEC/Rec2 [Bacillota bacterium]